LKKINKDLVRLGEKIREVRKENGLSQERLALNASLDRSYIGSVERGERNLSFLTLVKIAQCLKCDIARFTKDIPDE
jgi:transcriptional regulator with XRE-family HTH domain